MFVVVIASVIPRDHPTVYRFAFSEGSLCGKDRESNVLDVNSAYTLYTNNQGKQF